MRKNNINKKKNPKELDNVLNITRLPNTPRYDYTEGHQYPRQTLSRIPASRSRSSKETFASSRSNNSRETPAFNGSFNPRETPASSRSNNSRETIAPPRSNNPRRERKKKQSLFMGRIFFLILFISGVIYLVNIVIQTMQKPIVSYQMVQRGMLDNAETLTGLIVRDEKVIMSEDTGNIYMIAGEGDKVRRTGAVYQILDSLAMSKIQNDIQKVEEDIERVQDKRQEISYYQNEIQEVNNNISNRINGYYMLNQDGKMHGTHELKKEIEYEITRRNNIHMKDNTSTLSNLKVQKNELATKLSSNQKTYTSPEPGIISYYIDGYEEQFKFENIDNISEKDINQKYTYINTTMNEELKKDEPAYKIIQGDKWYVVCYMSKSLAENFKEGRQYTFSLIDENNIELTLTVESNKEDGKKHKIIFSSREQQELFLSKRTISFKSLQYIYEGLKLPTSAITERNLIKIPSEYIVEHEGGQGVLRQTGETKESVFLSLDIQFKDEKGYSHVLQDYTKHGGLQLGDIIVNPSQNDTIYTTAEVSTIQGVYVVNGRITKFKQIDILAQNNEYAIVQSNSMNGLKQFDQIITNPKNIQEEQLLRNMDVQNIKK